MATPYAYFKKQIVPLEDAKIGVMTHAFNYGTAVFEGIRGNWNAEEQQIYLFRLKEHFDRLRQSCRIMCIEFPYENEELYSIATRIWENGHADDESFRRIYGSTRSEMLAEFRAGAWSGSRSARPEALGGRAVEPPAAEDISLHDLSEFTYWLFRYRLRYADPAKVASDTRKGLALLARLESRRERGTGAFGLR